MSGTNITSTRRNYSQSYLELPVRCNSKTFVGEILSTAKQQNFINQTTGGGSVNLYKLGTYTEEKEFETDDNEIQTITNVKLNNINYNNQNVDSWYNQIVNGSNTNKIILQLTSTTNSSINGKYLLSSSSFINPSGYRGFAYYYKRVWNDDPSINQLIIYDSSLDNTVMTFDPTSEDDEFKVTGLSSSNIVAYCVIYGDSISTPVSLQQLNNFFESFVDNVLYGGGSTIVNLTNMRSSFYSSYSTLASNLPPLYPNFQLVDRGYTVSQDLTSGTGINCFLTIGYINFTYNISSIINSGSGYNINDTITILGNNLGGTTPENDLVCTVTNVGGSGEILDIVVTSGVADALNDNNINDGGDDQYDNGNYLNTDFNTEINYGRGEIVSNEFGNGSEFFTAYNESIFIMIASGNSSDSFYITGNLGADGEGNVSAGQVTSNSGPIDLDLEFLGGSGVINTGDICSLDFTALEGTWNYNNINGDIYSTNYIGIGTDSPSYPLDIQSQEGDISINAIGDIQANDFINPSDIRIKNKISDVDVNKSLDIINKLSVKNYNKISKLDNIEKNYIGFIAQDVKNIDENLVKTISNYIPNINKTFIAVKENNNYILQIEDTYDIQLNDMIKILVDNNIKELVINQKIDNNFIVNLGKELVNHSVYVYGKKVDDFLLLKQNSINIHLCNVVKELINKNKNLEDRIKLLENK
jgi:hypothetical protein